MKCALVYPKRNIPQHKRCQAPLADGTQCGSYKRHNKPTCANHAKFKVLRMRNKTKYFKKCYKNGTSRGRLMTEPCGAQCISDKKKGISACEWYLSILRVKHTALNMYLRNAIRMVHRVVLNVFQTKRKGISACEW